MGYLYKTLVSDWGQNAKTLINVSNGVNYVSGSGVACHSNIYDTHRIHVCATSHVSSKLLFVTTMKCVQRVYVSVQKISDNILWFVRESVHDHTQQPQQK